MTFKFQMVTSVTIEKEFTVLTSSYSVIFHEPL